MKIDKTTGLILAANLLALGAAPAALAQNYRVDAHAAGAPMAASAAGSAGGVSRISAFTSGSAPMLLIGPASIIPPTGPSNLEIWATPLPAASPALTALPAASLHTVPGQAASKTPAGAPTRNSMQAPAATRSAPGARGELEQGGRLTAAPNLDGGKMVFDGDTARGAVPTLTADAAASDGPRRKDVVRLKITIRRQLKATLRPAPAGRTPRGNQDRSKPPVIEAARTPSNPADEPGAVIYPAFPAVVMFAVAGILAAVNAVMVAGAHGPTPLVAGFVAVGVGLIATARILRTRYLANRREEALYSRRASLMSIPGVVGVRWEKIAGEMRLLMEFSHIDRTNAGQIPQYFEGYVVWPHVVGTPLYNTLYNDSLMGQW